MLLSEFIDKTLDKLPLVEIDKIIESGGSCFFFIGIYSEGNMLCYFDAELLVRLSNHAIGLKFDFYGGPEIMTAINILS